MRLRVQDLFGRAYWWQLRNRCEMAAVIIQQFVRVGADHHFNSGVEPNCGRLGTSQKDVPIMN